MSKEEQELLGKVVLNVYNSKIENKVELVNAITIVFMKRNEKPKSLGLYREDY